MPVQELLLLPYFTIKKLMTFFQIYFHGLLIIIGLMSVLPVLGSLLMTALIIKVSGVTLLEKNLVEKKQEYREYIERTSAFFPWFPKK